MWGYPLWLFLGVWIVLYARAADGQVDRLHCGPGRDRAFLRAEDQADASCERVVIVAGAEADPGDGDDLPKGDEKGGRKGR